MEIDTKASAILRGETYLIHKGLPSPNRRLIYLGACLIVGIRLARAGQVNVRVIPTSTAIEESIELARDVFERVFKGR